MKRKEPTAGGSISDDDDNKTTTVACKGNLPPLLNVLNFPDRKRKKVFPPVTNRQTVIVKSNFGFLLVHTPHMW